MKAGSGTSANITLEVYRDTNFTGTLVARQTLTISEFCAQHPGNAPSKCQGFDPISFLFSSAVSLNSNTTHFVDLVSAADTNGSNQYFIKGNTSTLSFFDSASSTGNAIPEGNVTNVSTTGTSAPTTSAPEPVSGALLGAGLVGLGAVRLRKRDRNAAEQ